LTPRFLQGRIGERPQTYAGVDAKASPAIDIQEVDTLDEAGLKALVMAAGERIGAACLTCDFGSC
jgi:hypothetical protein